jgi:hypothetical protein
VLKGGNSWAVGVSVSDSSRARISARARDLSSYDEEMGRPDDKPEKVE